MSDVAWSNISIFDTTFADFLYQTQVAAEGKARKRVQEDGKIFQMIDREINATAKSLASSCSLDGITSNSLRQLIQENQALYTSFQQIVVGNPPASMTGIREKNRAVWDALQTSYSPAATNNCETPNKSLSDRSAAILESISDIGGKTERALDAWRKAIALFQ